MKKRKEPKEQKKHSRTNEERYEIGLKLIDVPHLSKKVIIDKGLNHIPESTLKSYLKLAKKIRNKELELSDLPKRGGNRKNIIILTTPTAESELIEYFSKAIKENPEYGFVRIYKDYTENKPLPYQFSQSWLWKFFKEHGIECKPKEFYNNLYDSVIQQSIENKEFFNFITSDFYF